MSQIDATATELLDGLPQRLDQVFLPWSRSAPDRPALIGDGKVWSYGALAVIVDDAAAALRDHGVRAGDRVMVVSENSPALAALILALSVLDAWSVVSIRACQSARSTRSAIIAACACSTTRWKSRISPWHMRVATTLVTSRWDRSARLR